MITNNLIETILITICTSGVVTGILLFAGKKWLGKRIDHSFDIKIEDYKATLGKEALGYQIEKAEFVKKRAEHVTNLHSLVLERAMRNEDFHSIIDERGFQQVRSRFDNDKVFFRQAQGIMLRASLYLDQSLVKVVGDYLRKSEMLIMTMVTIAENRIVKEDYEHQKQFEEMRVTESNPNVEYDEKSATLELISREKSTGDAFEKVNSEFRKFLAV